MQLDRLNLLLRPRNHYEALDLGVVLARRHYLVLVTLFSLPALVVLAVASVVANDYPFVVLLLVWLGKPLYERLPTHYLSQVIFNDKHTVADTISARRECFRGAIRAMTFMRLSSRRSFDTPVWLLEGDLGNRRGARISVLGRRAGSAATWLTLISIHIESFLVLGMLAAFWSFVPDGLFDSAELIGFLASSALMWTLVLSSVLAMCVVAPFYIAAGFCLYLNRRVELEAWDVEVGFRRLAARLATLVVAVGLGLGQAPPLIADERIDESRAVIAEVLEHEDFNQRQITRYPEFVLNFTAEEDDPQPLGWDWLVKSIAFIAQVVLWLAVGALIVWVIYRLRKTSPGINRGAEDTSLPTSMFGLEIEQTTVPVDVESAAREAWQARNSRQALSLLLRGALVHLAQRHGCRFTVADTEGECLAQVSDRAPAASQAFANLINTWQRVAYAHRDASAEEFETLLNEYRTHWGAA